MKLKFCALIILLSSAFLLYGQTFLHRYERPGEVINRVTTLKTSYGGSILLGLEGYYQQTGAVFSRLQSIDTNGIPLDGYDNAYIGDALKLSSGVFESQPYISLRTPMIDLLPQNQFRFRWLYSNPDSSYYWEGMEYMLPDSIQTILDFPVAIDSYEKAIWASSNCLIAGRAIVNGIYRCFILDMDDWGSSQSSFCSMIFVPNLARISGMTKIEGGNYLVVGQAGNRLGIILLLDNTGNEIWQQTFSDAADIAATPLFNTPLLASGYNLDVSTTPKVISYQNKNRILYIAKYQNRVLQEIYSEQLDSYIGAAPIVLTDTLITFAYVKNGTQFLKQIDLSGNVHWSRELPGIGNFGKHCLISFMNYYLVAGRLRDDGFYLAKVNALDGTINYDDISQPQKLHLLVHPNPITDIVNVTFDIEKSGWVKLELYDIKGQKILTLMNTIYPQGKFRNTYALKTLTRDRMASGIYLLRLEQEDSRTIQKLLYQR